MRRTKPVGRPRRPPSRNRPAAGSAIGRSPLAAVRREQHVAGEVAVYKLAEQPDWPTRSASSGASSTSVSSHSTRSATVHRSRPRPSQSGTGTSARAARKAQLAATSSGHRANGSGSPSTVVHAAHRQTTKPLNASQVIPVPVVARQGGCGAVGRANAGAGTGFARLGPAGRRHRFGSGPPPLCCRVAPAHCARQAHSLMGIQEATSARASRVSESTWPVAVSASAMTMP